MSLSMEPPSASAFMDKYAGAARKVMVDGLTGSGVAETGEFAVVEVDAVGRSVIVLVAFQLLPLATATAAGGRVAVERPPASLTAGRLIFACPLNQLSDQAFVGSAGGGVAVVRTPVSQPMEDDCTFSCLIEVRLAVPESEFVCEPSPFVSLSAFAFSDRFASAARKVMPVGLVGSRAAGMGEDAVVNKDAIRTPLMLHVACQHLLFATSLSPGGTY